MIINRITFKTILPIWRDYLWKDRSSEIKPVSSITFNGDIDMDIYKNEPSFFSLMNKNEIVGVISGFLTSKSDYRCRGIFIFPKYRKQSLSKMLFNSCVNEAMNEKCQRLWSLPRKSAYYAYKKFGFKRTSSWTDEYEFGPNCFVEYLIK